MSHQTRADLLKQAFTLTDLSGSGWSLEACLTEIADDLFEYRFGLRSETERPLPRLTIEWHLPMGDAMASWAPDYHHAPHLAPIWCNDCRTESDLVNWVPIGLFHNPDGINCGAMAFSDAIRHVESFCGVSEDHCRLEFKLKLFEIPEAPCDRFDGTIRIDLRRRFYAEILSDFTRWYESFPEYRPAPVPDACREVLYSSWYSYHQEVFASEIYKECAAAVPYGIRSVIVDDGWQTDDNRRGYAYCGDWRISKRRFPDFAAHVREIQKLGVRYCLWYSVPSVGCRADNYEYWKPKFLWELNPGPERFGILDPRFPEVRQFLSDTYAKAVRDWNLDGLKLDFIDGFKVWDEDPAVRDNYAGRDCKNIFDAVTLLLEEVSQRLRSIRPDIMIEFRQNYVGPAIRKYGNMFRAADCPADPLSNRIRTLKLRLTSGNTAVHSDMIEWAMDSSVENAAYQIQNIFFSVPQISMRLEELPPEHRRMLKFQLGFWREHRDLLLDAPLTPLHPELNYPVVYAENSTEKIALRYAPDFLITFPAAKRRGYLVNAAGGSPVPLKLEEAPRNVRLQNVTGEVLQAPPLRSGLQMVPLPAGALLTLEWA